MQDVPDHAIPGRGSWTLDAGKTQRFCKLVSFWTMPIFGLPSSLKYREGVHSVQPILVLWLDALPAHLARGRYYSRHYSQFDGVYQSRDVVSQSNVNERGGSIREDIYR